jgi:hypothetical protein
MTTVAAAPAAAPSTPVAVLLGICLIGDG